MQKEKILTGECLIKLIRPLCAFRALHEENRKLLFRIDYCLIRGIVTGIRTDEIGAGANCGSRLPDIFGPHPSFGHLLSKGEGTTSVSPWERDRG